MSASSLLYYRKKIQHYTRILNISDIIYLLLYSPVFIIKSVLTLLGSTVKYFCDVVWKIIWIVIYLLTWLGVKGILMVRGKMKVVDHKRLQQYEHHYGMVCLTGFLGCRWHRYQQSQEPSSKCDIVWYLILLVASLFCLFWFYFWLLAENSSDNFNWYLYDNTGSWGAYFSIIFILTCITLSYLCLLNILALCHIGHNHQIHIHWTHKVLLVLILAACVAVVIVICDVWSAGWALQASSLQITAPFLHVGAVILMTCVTWFIAGYWLSLYKTAARVILLGLYIALMLFLYAAPVLVHSPCIAKDSELPEKPLIVGHRGLPGLRPENTIISFQAAAPYVITFESDVTVSFDGVPFLMHDTKLKRTTNVESVWPEHEDIAGCWFNRSEIDVLDAGSWYLENDPFKSKSDIPKSDRAHFINQSIPHLSDYLQEAIDHKKNIMFDVTFKCFDPKHPYYQSDFDVIIDTINKSGIDHKQVWWLVLNKNGTYPGTENFTLVYRVGNSPLPPVNDLLQRNIKMVNAEFGHVSLSEMKDLQSAGIKVNMYIVDSAWLYSLYWCMGVDSVTTNHADQLHGQSKPVWFLSPREFRAMWITTDVVSAAVIILLFIIQQLRRSGMILPKTINSERISLQGARIRMSHLHKNRTMREKLLYTVEGLQEIEQGNIGISSENLASPTTPDSRNSVTSGESAGVPTSSTRGAVHPLTISNRISGVSGWSGISGISGISAISGTDVGDSSFNRAPNEEETNNEAKFSEVTREVPA